MGWTLTGKTINGHEYFYLCRKKRGKVVCRYLGKSSSAKFKKYLLSLTTAELEDPLQKARLSSFRKGLPVAYIEGGYLVLEYKNGAKEFLNSAYQVERVEYE